MRIFSEETKAKMRANHADFRRDKHPQWKGGRIEVYCSWCGNLIKKTRWQIANYKAHFCNNACKTYWLKGRPSYNKGKLMPLEQRVKLSEAKKGCLSPLRGRHLSEETKLKLRAKHLGKSLSLETKAKISKAGKDKNAGERNPMYGTVAWNRGMHPKDWLKNISYDVMLKRAAEASKIKPTSLEKRLIALITDYSLPFNYVGDGQVWIAGLCPDFINTNHQKQLIEVFGDYWHNLEDEDARKTHFAKYGFETLVLWEHDLKRLSDEEIAQKIVSLGREA